MPNQVSPTPSFQNPPVMEVVCGMQFLPLEGMQAPHFGVLWKLYESEFPRIQSKAPLPPTPGTLGEDVAMEFNEVPPLPRIWFINSDETGVIQIQNDRLFYNWKHGESVGAYPRYCTIVEKFKYIVTKFSDFCEQYHLGDLQIIQLELAYINHIHKNVAWNNFGDIGNILPDFSWNNQKSLLSMPSAVNYKLQFDLPDETGKLHISAQSARLKEQEEDLLRFDLIVRGRPREIDENTIWDWFNDANKTIVNSFVDLTDKEVQKNVWGRYE
jgi:uncharacterized protein (TIGR04255 family)